MKNQIESKPVKKVVLETITPPDNFNVKNYNPDDKDTWDWAAVNRYWELRGINDELASKKFLNELKRVTGIISRQYRLDSEELLASVEGELLRKVQSGDGRNITALWVKDIEIARKQLHNYMFAVAKMDALASTHDDQGTYKKFGLVHSNKNDNIDDLLGGLLIKSELIQDKNPEQDLIEREGLEFKENQLDFIEKFVSTLNYSDQILVYLFYVGYLPQNIIQALKLGNVEGVDNAAILEIYEKYQMKKPRRPSHERQLSHAIHQPIIAVAYGIPTSTINYRLLAIRKKLKAAMQEARLSPRE